MFFSNYKKAFDILSSVENMSDIYLEKVYHSADGKWIVFVTSNPNIRYFVELKTGKVAKKVFEGPRLIKLLSVEWLN